MGKGRELGELDIKIPGLTGFLLSALLTTNPCEMVSARE
jgi:hypothetical protein